MHKSNPKFEIGEMAWVADIEDGPILGQIRREQDDDGYYRMFGHFLPGARNEIWMDVHNDSVYKTREEAEFACYFEGPV